MLKITALSLALLTTVTIAQSMEEAPISQQTQNGPVRSFKDLKELFTI